MPGFFFGTSKSAAALPNSADTKQALNKLVEKGFPKKVSDAFQKAADELNCVILSRVPGAAATTMIDEGYDLKPFYIHAKSCDWGPMAGFVCQLPAINKAGSEKLDYNLNEHILSLIWLEKKQAEYLSRLKQELRNKLKADGGAAFLQAYHKIIKQEPGAGEFQLSPVHSPEDLLESLEFSDLEAPPIADSLFLPLSISDARKDTLIQDNYLGTLGTDYKKIGDSQIIGIAQDKDSTVAVEYLMKQRPNSNLWDLYHRNIFIKQEDETKYVSYLESANEGFSIQKQQQPSKVEGQLERFNQAIEDYNRIVRDKQISNLNADFNSLLSSLKITPDKKPLKKFYPISGLQNPYLAYQEEKDRYKNAVAGDYDLFAVWPFVPQFSFELTTRISELKTNKSPDYHSQNLFLPVEAKKYALEMTKSRNVFIEFIGSGDELAGIEDPEIGNINELVSYTAQMLNALVMAAYKGAGNVGRFPNRAFHSDEGGRPQVDEVEYPMAFFMPKAQWGGLQPSRHKNEAQAAFNTRKSEFQKNIPVLKSSAGLVNSHFELVSLILELKKCFYIFLHDGWMMHLISLTYKEVLLNALTRSDAVGTERKKYFKARIKEGKALQNSSSDTIEKIRSLLMELLTSLKSGSATVDDKIQKAYATAYELVEISFIENASPDKLPSVTERINNIFKNKIKIPE